MTASDRPIALVVGAGDGLSASLARLLAREGYGSHLAARRTVEKLMRSPGDRRRAHRCDASEAAQVVSRVFDRVGDVPDVVVYNPSYRVRGPIADLDPAEVHARPCTWRPLGPSWSASRQPGGCCRPARARSCSPARRRA